MVAVTERLGCFLAGRIRLQWAVAVGRFRGGVGRIRPIDAGGGSQDELPDPLLAAKFEHVQSPGRVRLHKGPGVLNACPYPGARRQVDDGVKFALKDRRLRIENLAVRNVASDELETSQSLQLTQAKLLHAHIVGIVQVIHAGNGMPLLDQHFTDPAPDKPGRAGNKIISHKCYLMEFLKNVLTTKYKNKHQVLFYFPRCRLVAFVVNSLSLVLLHDR